MSRSALLRWLAAGSAAITAAMVVADVPRPAAHHRAGGFQNNYVEFAPRGLGALLEWKMQASRDGLITDPIFSQRASPLSFLGPKRHVAPGVPMAELPHIDVVLISHNHYDHLDAGSVKGLNDQADGPPLFVVPLGIKPWLASQGITSAIELDWWQSTSLGAAEFVLTPVQHWSGRSLNDRMEALWGGYAVFAPDRMGEALIFVQM